MADTDQLWDDAWCQADDHDWRLYGGEPSTNAAFAEGVVWGSVWLAAIIDWAEAIRSRPSRTEPCEWCGKPTVAWRAMCDACEWGTEP